MAQKEISIASIPATAPTSSEPADYGDPDDSIDFDAVAAQLNLRAGVPSTPSEPAPAPAPEAPAAVPSAEPPAPAALSAEEVAPAPAAEEADPAALIAQWLKGETHADPEPQAPPAPPPAQAPQAPAAEEYTADQLKALARRDPAKFFELVGADPLDTANSLYAHVLGEDAPEKLKQQKLLNELRREQEDEIRKLREEQQNIRAEIQRAQETREVERLDQELADVAVNVPEQFDLVSRVAKNDAYAAYQAMAQFGTELRNKLGRWPTSQQVLQYTEAEFARQARLFGLNKQQQSVADAPSKQDEGKIRQPTQSLGERDAIDRPNNPADFPDPEDSAAWAKYAAAQLSSQRFI